MPDIQPEFFGFPTLAERWAVHRDTLIRAANRGELKTVAICGRRMVPRSEVERVERFGLGSGRKRRSNAQ